MKLLTEAIVKKLPSCHSTAQVPLAEKIVQCKFFDPCSIWTWYVIEGEPTEDGDWEFWGLVVGHVAEWGYFRLSELAALRGRLGLPLERDLHLPVAPIRELLPERHRAEALR